MAYGPLSLVELFEVDNKIKYSDVAIYKLENICCVLIMRWKKEARNTDDYTVIPGRFQYFYKQIRKSLINAHVF
jgi:hypothetical protein